MGIWIDLPKIMIFFAMVGLQEKFSKIQYKSFLLYVFWGDYVTFDRFPKALKISKTTKVVFCSAPVWLPKK